MMICYKQNGWNKIVSRSMGATLKVTKLLCSKHNVSFEGSPLHEGWSSLQVYHIVVTSMGTQP